MRRSKLEMYVDILKVLQRGPLELTHIMSKANVNCKVLKECFDFLVGQGFVEESLVSKSNVVYAIAQRGISVIKYFRELNTTFQMEEENSKTCHYFY